MANNEKRFAALEQADQQLRRELQELRQLVMQRGGTERNQQVEELRLRAEQAEQRAEQAEEELQRMQQQRQRERQRERRQKLQKMQQIRQRAEQAEALVRQLQQGPTTSSRGLLQANNWTGMLQNVVEHPPSMTGPGHENVVEHPGPSTSSGGVLPADWTEMLQYMVEHPAQSAEPERTNQADDLKTPNPSPPKDQNA